VNYKSNLSVLKNFADVSTFLLAALFSDFLSLLMTLLFMLFSSSFRQFYKQDSNDEKTFPLFFRGKNFVFRKLSRKKKKLFSYDFAVAINFSPKPS
jgi:hypothetical protein